MNQKIFAIVPVKSFEKSKSRLSSLLSVQERVELTELMLVDTITVLTGSTRISETIIVSSDRRAEIIGKKLGAIFLKEDVDRGVNQAVSIADNYSVNADTEGTLTIPQDLPLLLSSDIDIVCRTVTNYEKCIVICPSLRQDGSNILFRKPADVIRTRYDCQSYRMHILDALGAGATIRTFLSERTMIDLDTMDDLELLNRYPSQSSRALTYIKKKIEIFRIRNNRII